jgi:DNA-binding response OmpR family regulator
MKILLVEDDQPTSSALSSILTKQYYSVNVAADGQKALELAKTFEYDLILLDIIIPKIDGISVCRHLRNYGYQNPILLLTAKDHSDDRVMGLDAGADDYVVKPFDLPEFLARIRALLRRGKSISSTVTTWENLQLDTIISEITCDGQRLHLTPKEYCLLELFLLNPKRIYNRTAILDKLWDFADSPGEETVSTHIKCLRQKLRAAGASDPIETVHGLGYRLRQPSEVKIESMPESTVLALKVPSSTVPEFTKPENTSEARQILKSKTLKIWEKHKGTISKQVSVLEEAAQALIISNLTSQIQEKAKGEAHKLAGSLGLFGLKQGSVLAHDLENLLQPNIHLENLEVQQIAELTKLLRIELDNAVVGLNANEPEPKSYSPLILIVDDDLCLADQVRIEAINWGMRVEVATDLTIAIKMISQTRPNVILLDLNFQDAKEDGLTLLQLTNQIPKIPIIAFTSRESLADRVEVARLGGCIFLHKQLPIYEIFNAVVETLKRQQVINGTRVLLVDDDIIILETLSNHLRDLGVEVKTLENSKQFWEVLTTFNPNLLVLDMKMPDFDGVQLCQVVRTDPYWQHLPILFLCANTTAAEIDRAFAAGADDYISKLTDQASIATRIFRRLQRGTLQHMVNRNA